MTVGAGRLRDRLERDSDAGVTLLEIMISMTLLSITMAIFTQGIIQLNVAARRIERLAVTESQVGVAYDRLQPVLSAATTLQLSADNQCAQYDVPTVQRDANGVPRIGADGAPITAVVTYRLRLAGNNLTLTPSNSTTVILASGVAAAPNENAFDFPAATDVPTGDQYRTLKINLVASATSGTTTTRELRAQLLATNIDPNVEAPGEASC